MPHPWRRGRRGGRPTSAGGPAVAWGPSLRPLLVSRRAAGWQALLLGLLGGGRRARGRRKAGRAGGEISRARGRSVGGQVPAGRFEAVTVLSRKFHQTIPFRILSFIIKSLKRDYLNSTHVLQFDLEIMRSKQGDLSSRIYFKINHNVLIFGLLLLAAQLVSCFGLRVNLIS